MAILYRTYPRSLYTGAVNGYVLEKRWQLKKLTNINGYFSLITQGICDGKEITVEHALEIKWLFFTDY